MVEMYIEGEGYCPLVRDTMKCNREILRVFAKLHGVTFKTI